ncbi:unnamed protein product [Meganyctiphanes norvegica]|uniref:Ileal sodium/bile acid cotransporter n=1 Tax=Meganyctiphanes norvegica TaxID=48144 RepID=A0AAV2SNC1_MEGNR
MKGAWAKVLMLVWSAALMDVIAHQRDESDVSSTLAPVDIWFEPEELTLIPEGDVVNITWYTTLEGVESVKFTVKDTMVSVVKSESNYTVMGTADPDGNYTFMGHVQAEALFIGYNTITMKLYNDNEEEIGEGSLKMTVQLSYQALTDAFTLALSIIVAIIYINMGCTLDFTVVKQIIKRPIGPAIGVVCQYGFMPLIAFGLAKLFFPDDSQLQLGMFLAGCCPGGGLSNMWTHLLGGSLNLSIMMTFVSTFIAFGSIPLWVLGMGPLIVDESDFVIPYTNIAVIALSAIVPCGVGVCIQKYLPRIAKIMKTLLTPFSIFNICFTLSFGIYANRYVFSILTWQIMLSGFALPFLGYLSGTVLAIICKRKFVDIIAISIETGVQNTSIAVFILKFTLEKPAGDLTVVVPALAYLSDSYSSAYRNWHQENLRLPQWFKQFRYKQ